jgi:hypothetical protein
MTPEQLAKSGSEQAHQSALFAALALGVAGKPSQAMLALGVRQLRPEALLAYAVHNQGHGDAIRGARAAAEGVKPGVPDICLPVPVRRTGTHASFNECWHGCYIELKRPMYATLKDGGCSADQVKWLLMLRDNGHYTTVAWGWHDALAKIHDYLAGVPWSMYDGFSRDTLSLLGR